MRAFQRQKISRRIASVAAATLMAIVLETGQTFANSSEPPSLSRSVSPEAAVVDIAGLRDSLERLSTTVLATSESNRRQKEDTLQNALQNLARGHIATQARSTGIGSYRSGKKPLQTDDSTALAALTSRLLTVQQGLPRQQIASMTSVDDLRRVMRRYPTVNDAWMSETFSAILLGLSDLAPTLSNELSAYPGVNKYAIRSEVVETRLTSSARPPPTVSIEYASPTLSPSGEENIAAIDALPSGDTGLVAGLDLPMGDATLGSTMPNQDIEWDGIGTGEETLVAMEDIIDLDQIDVDDLGDTGIASAATPVAMDDLQETRAGFLLDNGIKIDFAVTRMTSIDGLDQLHTITKLPEGLDTTALSQISVGRFANTQVLAPNSGAMVTMIQNDLDNQRILDVTAIDIGIQNLGVKSRDLIRPLVPLMTLPAELR